MRLVAVLAVLAIISLTLPLAASDDGKPRDALVVALVGTSPTGTLVTWSPAPGAIGYDIYRGPSLGSLTLIGSTASTMFSDHDTPAGDVWYVVVSAHPAFGTNVLFQQSKGQCMRASTTGVSIWASNCLPVRPI